MVLNFPFYRVNFSSNFYYVFTFVFSNNTIIPSVTGYNTLIDANTYFNNTLQSFATALSQNGFENVHTGYVEDNTDYIVQKVTAELSQSSSDNPDYTNILTSINSNLSSINASVNSVSTSIQSQNNQSDIVDCLKLIFVNRISGVESSVMKVNTNNDNVKQNSSIPLLLSRLVQFLSSDSNFTWGSSNDVQYRVLDNISKKLSLGGSDYIAEQSSILGAINLLRNSFISDSSTTAGSVRNNSYVKAISDKLANANDLHTISQAIDLISTAIAQTPTTDISPLTSAVQNLKLEQNNLIQVEGDIDYRIKYDKNIE